MIRRRFSVQPWIVSPRDLRKPDAKVRAKQQWSRLRLTCQRNVELRGHSCAQKWWTHDASRGRTELRGSRCQCQLVATVSEMAEAKIMAMTRCHDGALQSVLRCNALPRLSVCRSSGGSDAMRGGIQRRDAWNPLALELSVSCRDNTSTPSSLL